MLEAEAEFTLDLCEGASRSLAPPIEPVRLWVTSALPVDPAEGLLSVDEDTEEEEEDVEEEEEVSRAAWSMLRDACSS